MGQPRIPVDVKLFTAVTFNDRQLFEQVKSLLEQKFGAIEIVSAVYDFDYTQYYFHEMGSGLKKQLFGFKKLIRPESLPDIKIATNKIENDFKVDNKRKINIDPGYLAPGKVVLATTKNFDHRIYLGKGIYGDVHLRYRQNRFHFNYWTYPDYKNKYVINFMARLRKIYMKEYENLMKRNSI